MITLIGILLGISVGSFLNVVGYRLPVLLHQKWRLECCEYLNLDLPQPKVFEKLSLIWTRSFCPNCKNMISFIDNIPVISFLLLKGKCRVCSHKIPTSYFIVELITGAITGYACYNIAFSIELVCLLVFIWLLLALAVIDYKEKILPDEITITGVWLGLLVNSFEILTTCNNAVIGAILGYVLLYSIYFIHKTITGRIGMGHGDFKMMALIGAWLGYELIPTILFLAATTGFIVGCYNYTRASSENRDEIAFGPFLSAATIFIILAEDNLFENYFAMISKLLVL